MFVVFEGLDGTGKSTQMARARRYLVDKGFDVETLQEPSEVLGLDFRDNFLGKSLGDWSELLLFMADRAENVARRVRPALEQGKLVLQDRFFYSTRAYQGQKLELLAHWDLVDKLDECIVGRTRPDWVFFFDIDPLVARERIARVRPLDAIESRDFSYQEAVRRAFLDQQNSISNSTLLDATLPESRVWERIRLDLARITTEVS